jgi:hypothetical protein
MQARRLVVIASLTTLVTRVLLCGQRKQYQEVDKVNSGQDHGKQMNNKERDEQCNE